jgi:hypothetical protein
MTTHKHETRKLSDLTIHPLLKDSPMLGGDHPDVKNLMAAMMEEGLADNPIIITPDNQIMDGRHRAKAAAILEWPEIPVIVKPDADCEKIVTHAILARRHLLKWQIAYSVAPVLERYVEKGVYVRKNNLKVGVKLAEKPIISRKGQVDLIGDSDDSMTLFLRRAGISVETWKRVHAVRKKFEKRPDLKDQYEPRMFLPDSDPQAISLEGVMKAIGAVESYETNKHDLKALRGQHDRLALDLMKKAGAQLEFFEKLEPAKQKKLAEETVQAVRLWPMELKKELLSALQQDFIVEQKTRKIK